MISIKIGHQFISQLQLNVIEIYQIVIDTAISFEIQLDFSTRYLHPLSIVFFKSNILLEENIQHAICYSYISFIKVAFINTKTKKFICGAE